MTSVAITETSAITTTLLHATAATGDPDGDVVTVAWQWTRNGTDIAGATSSTLDLAVAGNGDRGDVIRVRAVPSDGSASGSAATSGALTVANSAPTVGVALSPTDPQTNDILTATATPADLDGDTVTMTFQWTVNGVVRQTHTQTATTDTFSLATAGNGDTGDVVVVQVTPSDGSAGGSSATASATVAADSTPPAPPAGPTSSATTRAVALDWSDNTEADLAGYRVYRGSSISGPFTLLTTTPITGSAFTDTTTLVGTLYYRLVAVDTRAMPRPRPTSPSSGRLRSARRPRRPAPARPESRQAERHRGRRRPCCRDRQPRQRDPGGPGRLGPGGPVDDGLRAAPDRLRPRRRLVRTYAYSSPSGRIRARPV